MKAIVCEATGPGASARYRDFPEPVAGPGEVIVEARAMSVNFPDVLQIEGRYQVMPACPFVLGMEFSGIVRALGPGCTRLKPGDRVAGMTQGAFAEIIKAREQTCYPLPRHLGFEAAAAMPLAGGTALYALSRRGHLAAGETLAVLGAAGGTGLSAVQVGKALGARVIAICSSEEKIGTARAGGADAAINYVTEDLSGRLNDLTDGRGVDVLYDPVGGGAFDIASRRLAWNGRILVVGFASGTIPKLSINLPLVKGYSLIGVHWAAAIEREPDSSQSVIGELFALHERGLFAPVIDSYMKLQDGLEAIRKMRDRQVNGKIVLIP
jgi:NADPH2:quinone reductase